MEFGWQDITALGVLLAAVGYLARLAWSAVTRTQSAGCGSSCGGCPSQTVNPIMPSLPRPSIEH
jgi:hypothetical protein